MVDFTRTKPAVAAPAKKAKSAPETIKIKGLETYAAVDFTAKALKTTCETLGSGIKTEARDIFIAQGIQYGKRPGNLKAEEGAANASIQLKALPSALSAEAVEKLTAAKIPLAETDQVVETFRINPKYAEDDKLLAKVKAALETVKGIPEDFIEFQSQKKISCDGDRTIDAIFRLKTKGVPDRAKIETLLPLVTTLAIKATTTETLEECLERIEDFISDGDGE